MNGKERIDYLLTKVPEDKKEAFVEDLKGVAGLEDGLSVLKKYGVALTEEEMQQLTSKREMSDEELEAHDFSRGEILDGIKDICDMYGVEYDVIV